MVTSVARVVPQRITAVGFFQRCSQAGIRRLDQNRAYVNPAVGHHAAVVTDEVVLIQTVHHFRSNALFFPIAASALRLGADTECRQDFNAWPVVAVELQEPRETVEEAPGIVVLPD